MKAPERAGSEEEGGQRELTRRTGQNGHPEPSLPVSKQDTKQSQVSTQAMPNSSEREGRVYTPSIYQTQFNTETQKQVQKKGVHYHQLLKGERTQKEPCPHADSEM